ncbi:MAG: hypothetical protein IJW16_07270 [Clostridia bacterium]|nr:hypothetical protein [Clostridia bacterium]
MKKKLPIIMLAALVVSVAAAIVLLAVAVPNSDATYKTVLSVICASLFFVLAALIVAYFLFSRDTEPNFFLFDRAKKRNISVDHLNFTIVNERMTFFLTLVCEKPEDLWQEGVLEDNRKFGYRGVYKPLVAYKMLYDLGDKDNTALWDIVKNATPETIASVCNALERGGETEMVKAFRYIYENFREDDKKMRDFVCGNLRYLRGKMLAYVKRHIELFY